MNEQLVSWQFSLVEVVGLWVICYFASMFAIGTVGWYQRRQKQKAMEDFLSHLYQKIQTEEEFQEIIEQMRRDFGGGPTGNN